MLPAAKVTRQIIASRTALGRVRRAVAEDFEGTDFQGTVRREIDVLTTLLDETEPSVHWKIKSLIYEFEALAKKMVH